MNPRLQALDIFEEALGLPLSQRESYLRDACSDSEVLNEVRRLLANADACDDFLVTQPSAKTALEDKVSSLSRFHVGAVLQDRYEIIRVLGQGGMGEVYLGRDRRLERSVAIKVVREMSSNADELRQRFDRELKSVAKLSNSNVVTLFDYVLGETPFAVMEYVEGETLEALIRQRLDSASAIVFGKGIATGLAAAHNQGLIHRDIKPANVIVTTDGIPKVLDFGLARQDQRGIDQNLTNTAVTPGTIPYMSPEQADGRELTCATDVFSLGTVIYEMLSGTNPFRSDSALATLNNIVRAKPRRLNDEGDDLPRALADLVHRMLAREPADRPSAQDVANELSDLSALTGHRTGNRGVRPDGRANDTRSSDRMEPRSPRLEPALRTESTHQDNKTRLHPQKEWQPILIVLPFQTFGEKLDLESLADGLVENLTTILTRVPMLSITSRMTSFSLKGLSVTASDIRARFNADYMIEGSLQRVGDSVRANVQLIETATESHAWAQQFDCESSDGMLDDLLFGIIPQLERQLVRAILVDLQDEDGSPTSRHLLVRAMSHLSLRGWHQDSFVEVIEFLKRSLSLDPKLAMTHAYLALIQGLSNRVGLSTDSEEAEQEALRHAERALELDDLDSNVLGLVGCALTDIGQLNRGEELLHNAIEVNPRNAQAHAALGTSSLVRGNYDEAIQHLRNGIELSPVDGRLAVWYASLAIAYVQVERFDDALDAAKRGCRSDRKSYLPRVALAAVHLVREEPEPAKAALQESLRVKPDLCDEEIKCLIGRRLAIGIRRLRRSL